ncbi:unnamed protein product [Absidia cylindrospora]
MVVPFSLPSEWVPFNFLYYTKGAWAFIYGDENWPGQHDIRLQSLDSIYLFSEDVTKSVSKYCGVDVHNELMKGLLAANHTELDPMVFQWCSQLSNVSFQSDMGKWMELKMKTTEILTKAAATRNMASLMIADMLHTIAPRLYLSSYTASLEDTHVHTVISYILKCIFGSEELLKQQW